MEVDKYNIQYYICNLLNHRCENTAVRMTKETSTTDLAAMVAFEVGAQITERFMKWMEEWIEARSAKNEPQDEQSEGPEVFWP